MFHIVLLEPEIPFNTGNIGRTCLVTGSHLHLIEPMGFILNDKNLKRAGMDYWKELDVTVYDSWRDFVWKNADRIRFPVQTLQDTHYPGLSGNGSSENGSFRGTEKGSGQKEKATLWMASTKAPHTHDSVCYRDGDYIMFGKESAGIPEEILIENEETCIRIPMLNEIRSLNLSNSVAIVLYEALRQQGFSGLQKKGELHRLSWKD